MKVISLSVLFLLLILTLGGCWKDSRIKYLKEKNINFNIICLTLEGDVVGTIEKQKDAIYASYNGGGANCELKKIKTNKNNIIFYLEKTIYIRGFYMEDDRKETLYYKCYFSNKNLEDLLSGKERYFELIGEKYK